MIRLVLLSTLTLAGCTAHSSKTDEPNTGPQMSQPGTGGGSSIHAVATSVQSTPSHRVPGTRLFPPSTAEARRMYPWHRRAAGYAPLSARIATPKGFRRRATTRGSYAHYLRHLPLLAKGSPVRDYSGALLPDSTRAAASVIDLDVGKRDLQQCMDTIMRIRAEYLWYRQTPDKVAFLYAGGRAFGWAQWRRGIRPRSRGRTLSWPTVAKANASRANFDKYLTFMFAMTGTIHAVGEPRVKRLANLAAGDFFIQPAKSATILGHAIIVLDIADGPGGTVKALLGEGYTPAQDFHVLRNPSGGTWYSLNEQTTIDTPLWPGFTWKNLRRFRH